VGSCVAFEQKVRRGRKIALDFFVRDQAAGSLTSELALCVVLGLESGRFDRCWAAPEKEQGAAGITTAAQSVRSSPSTFIYVQKTSVVSIT
jgi:hypothetical protein